MFGNLDIFQMASSLASYAGSRQALIAQNVANADTPGYKAQDLRSFDQVFARQQAGARRDEVWTPKAAASPNGNSVSLEQEIMKASMVKQDHDQALAIYRSALTILRSALGRG